MSSSPAAEGAIKGGLISRIQRLFPSGQFVRYLGVGVWNTIFGYGLYVLFVHLFSKLLPHRYLPLTVDLASVLSTPIGITNSFLCYKFFVFHTTGNYLKEWLRCFAVYGTGMIPNLIALPILTRALQTMPRLHGVLAGYVAGALMTGFTAVYSYFGHKKFPSGPDQASRGYTRPQPKPTPARKPEARSAWNRRRPSPSSRPATTSRTTW